jgi:hypothetical protein
VLVRGRTDDSDKGRVVLVDEVRPLEEPMTGNGGGPAPTHPLTCRIRVGDGGDPGALIATVRAACEEHPGGTPVFVHVLLATQEVVIRARELRVSADAALVSRIETLLGPGSILVEYARRG